MKIAVAQIHSIAGDIEGNSHKLVEAIKEAKEQGARIVVTPEMAITGYPVEDLLGDQEFLTQAELATYRVARTVGDIYALIGSPMRAGAIEESLIVHPIDSLARDVYNAVVVAHNGEIIATHTKSLLPTYGVFDDSRWMVAGPVEQELINIDGVLCGLAVCEDVWTKEVALAASAKGAEILLVPNASPYHIGKPAYRLELLTELARDSKMTIVYANSVGGQDEVVYDGGSVIMKEDGVVQLSAPLFKEGVWSVDLDDAPVILRDKSDNDSETWQALVSGLRDYVHGNGFTNVIIGLSGGIDSAIAASLAVDALGAENVLGIGMPGPYSSEGSVSDAQLLADKIGVHFEVIKILDTVEAETRLINPFIIGQPGEKIARENIQARLRALHLMTLANAMNSMMLNTGNKSEAAVGYFTLGGDSSGGYAILKDVYKTRVYDLCVYRNKLAASRGEVEPIPLNTIIKPPSAELAPDQQDTDSLPPYVLLDAILKLYLEEQKSVSEIVDIISATPTDFSTFSDVYGGITDEMKNPDVLNPIVLKVLKMVDRAEHKRRQVAPGLKITARAFGRDRRMPITSKRKH